MGYLRGWWRGKAQRKGGDDGRERAFTDLRLREGANEFSGACIWFMH